MLSLTKDAVGDVFQSEGSTESFVNLGLSAAVDTFQVYQARRSSAPGYTPQRPASAATQRDSTMAYNAGKSVLLVAGVVTVVILGVWLIFRK